MHTHTIRQGHREQHHQSICDPQTRTGSALPLRTVNTAPACVACCWFAFHSHLPCAPCHRRREWCGAHWPGPAGWRRWAEREDEGRSRQAQRSQLMDHTDMIGRHMHCSRVPTPCARGPHLERHDVCVCERCGASALRCVRVAAARLRECGAAERAAALRSVWWRWVTAGRTIST